MEYLLGLMAISMMVHGQKVNSMEKDFIHLMVLLERDNGNMGKEHFGFNDHNDQIIVQYKINSINIYVIFQYIYYKLSYTIKILYNLLIELFINEKYIIKNI